MADRAAEIRARVAAGESQAAVARDVGVSRQRVHQIVHAPARPARPSPVRWTDPALKPVLAASAALLSLRMTRKADRAATPKARPARPVAPSAPTLDPKAMRQWLAQLKIMKALLAQRAALAGVPVDQIASITSLSVADPFAPLVPYARAMVQLKLRETTHAR